MTTVNECATMSCISRAILERSLIVAISASCARSSSSNRARSVRPSNCLVRTRRKSPNAQTASMKIMTATDGMTCDDTGIPSRPRIETTLTDGYACALRLDAECDRIERRLADRAAKLGDNGTAAQARELSALARLLAQRR